jgi:SAM-dependent methyltransferase
MQSTEYRWMSKTEGSLWWFVGKRRFVTAVMPPPDGTKRLLDIGAGTGGMSEYLERWGPVTRIESSPIAQEYLTKRALPFVSADINTCTLPANTYDLVTCCDVLYHKNIASDTDVIAKLYRTLKPGGMLLVTDCACPALYGPHDIRNNARERYRLSGLAAKIESCGFRITRRSYTFFSVFPLFAASRLLDRIHSDHRLRSGIPTYNRLLTAICVLEGKLLKKLSFPFGSSVIITAVKPA